MLKIWVLWRLYHHCGHGDSRLVQVEEYNHFFRFIRFLKFLRFLRFSKVQRSYGTGGRIRYFFNWAKVRLNILMYEWIFLRFAKVQRSYTTNERIQLSSNCVHVFMIEWRRRKGQTLIIWNVTGTREPQTCRE